MSGEQFDLRSPNFRRTYIPIPNMTSLSTSGQKLSGGKKLSKMPPPMALGGISRDRFTQRSRNFTHLSETIPINLANLLDMTSLAAADRL